MKVLLIAAVFFMHYTVNAQHRKEPRIQNIHEQLQKMRQQMDSSIKQLDTINTQINQGYKQTMDSAYDHVQAEQNNRNLEQFMTMQRERQAEEKRMMWLRLGLGIFFLAILVFGLMRRRKKI